ncbi:MAG: HK97 gp10 family phage protein [Bacilli bacterium]|nr:HK97 gp10 family phage protein [Bacilli bacterium]
MFDEILELQKELEGLSKEVLDSDNYLEEGASAFVKDLLKLPKPKSKIRASGYTHLVKSFTYQKSKYHKGEIEVGWGKYYGMFVEKGTSRMNKQLHFVKTFQSHSSKYYKLMIEKLKLN